MKTSLRILVLCTHNSARSQMMEGWLRRHLTEAVVAADVRSAGTVRTGVKPEALRVMAEAGIDLGDHRSKTLFELPDPWNFDLVLTVCDAAGRVSAALARALAAERWPEEDELRRAAGVE